MRGIRAIAVRKYIPLTGARSVADKRLGGRKLNVIWVLIIGIAIMAGTMALVVGWERRRARLLKLAGEALGLRGLQKGEQFRLPSVEIMRKRGRGIGAALEGVWR